MALSKLLFSGYLPLSCYDELPVNKPTTILDFDNLDPNLHLNSDLIIGLENLKLCSGGAGFALLLSPSGGLYSVGNANDYLQCGSGNSSKRLDSLTQVDYFLSQKVLFASAGKTFSFAITESGSLFKWGRKFPGEYETMALNHDLNFEHPNKNEENHEDAKQSKIILPIVMSDNFCTNVPLPRNHGPNEVFISPEKILFGQHRKNIVSVSVGLEHALALSDEGEVFGWGYGGEGQLGTGHRAKSFSSVRPIILPEFPDASIFGKKGNDCPGSQQENIYQSETNKQLLMKEAKAKIICCGGRHSAVISDRGNLITFGWNLYGQCGVGHTDDVLSSCHVSALDGLEIKDVAAGNFHTLCFTSSDDLFSFGANTCGQLGIGNNDSKVFPHLIEYQELEDTRIRKICCGSTHSACLTADGKLYTWGGNKFGQLGLGHNEDAIFPNVLRTDNVHNVKSVECGSWHTILCI